MCDAEGVAKQYCFKNLNQLWTSSNAKPHWSHGKSLSSLYTESFIFSLFDLFLSVWSIVMHSFEKIDNWDYLMKKTMGVSNTTPSALLRDWDLINYNFLPARATLKSGPAEWRNGGKWPQILKHETDVRACCTNFVQKHSSAWLIHPHDDDVRD